MNNHPHDPLNTNALWNAEPLVSKSAFNSKIYHRQSKKENERIVPMLKTKNGVYATANDNFPYESRGNINKIQGKEEVQEDSFPDGRYRKYIETMISIDSRDRNRQLFPLPNKYQLYLNRVMKNVYSITLIDIKIPNTIPPINNCNNRLQWIDSLGEHDFRIYPGFYKLDQLVSTITDIMNGVSSGDYYLNVNSVINKTTFISRIESEPIMKILTTAGSNAIQIEIDGFIPTGPNYIPTKIPSIGGIPTNEINDKEYLYTGTGIGPVYEELGATGTYLLWIYNSQGNPVNASTSIDYTVIGDDILSNDWPRIGSARDEFQLINNCDSVLQIIGWDPMLTGASSEDAIQTNFITVTGPCDTTSTIPSAYIQVIDTSPNATINSEDYIFMRLKTQTRAIDVITNNLIKATSDIERCDNVSNLFAKISLSLLPNDTSNYFTTTRKIFYLNDLNTLDNLIIEFVDRNGHLIETIGEHHMTIEILEKQDVLRRTGFDSRYGIYDDTGVADVLGDLGQY